MIAREITALEEPQAQPPILYHYTNINAFKSILESRKIRATRYDQMNDDTELQIGAERLLEAVERYDGNDECREYKEFLIAAIRAYREGGLDVYVLSLSEEADSLYQWRAYAPNGGIAIGFDLPKLRKGFLCDITSKVGGAEVEYPVRPDPSIRLMQCTYTDRQGQLDLRTVVGEQFFKDNSYSAIYRRPEPLARKLFCSTLAVAIYQTITCIKHGAYAQESEWRCVNFRPDARFYPRRLNERCRWCIEMEFEPREYIKEVWISPHGDKQACERTIQYFVEGYEWHPVIQRSTIPYRG
jgi:hypothetical protein